MATQTEYQKKLLDPRWQRKRLEILNRDGFKCVECHSEYKTLHVHHKNYTFGLDPWDYPDTNFITFCEDCHEMEEYYKDEFKGLIHDLLLMGYTYTVLACWLSENFNKIPLPYFLRKNG